MKSPTNSTDLFRLDGRSALITGGSKGLGEAMATALSGAGADVAITSRNAEESQATAERIKAHTGQRVLGLRADASRRDEAEASVAHVVETFGHIDILVNNAGINIRHPITELDDDSWNEVLAINLSGPLFYCRAAATLMIEQQYGRIINLCSTLSHISIPDRTPYASSKGGLLQMTRTLALELACHNITVNAICPGPFATPINEILIADPDATEAMISKVPLGRWGDPSELATTVLYFASAASSFTTGANLLVDGGYTVQ